jgi:hypothetical protein
MKCGTFLLILITDISQFFNFVKPTLSPFVVQAIFIKEKYHVCVANATNVVHAQLRFLAPI